MSADFVSLPGALAETRIVPGHGGRPIRLYRWRGGRAGGPALLWGHANGFAAGSYATLFAALAADLDIFAFDAAGCGGSAKPNALADPDKFCAPDALADDVFAAASAAREWAGRPLVYGGHSLNAAVMLHLALFGRARFDALGLRGLVLFEPPFFPQPGHPSYDAALARYRRIATATDFVHEDFPGGPDALADHLVRREPFCRFRPEQVAAHAHATLVFDGRTWRPAGSAAAEMAAFRAFGDRPDNFEALGRFPSSMPVRFVAGDVELARRHGQTITTLMPEAADRIAHARLTELAGASHMMVFERERACADLLKAFAADPESR